MKKLDELNRITMVWARKNIYPHIVVMTELSDAARRGYWCIRCRSPFVNIGLAVVCNCVRPITSPIVYGDDHGR